MMFRMRLAAATVLAVLIAGCAGTTAVTPSTSPVATSTVSATTAPTSATATQATTTAALACTAPAQALVELTEGPYYKANPPQNATLRTAHIHFKVTVNGKTYTSQLFFPGVSQNEGDSIYSSQMLVTLNTATSPVTGTFTFVVKA